jgi:hypothetical protein
LPGVAFRTLGAEAEVQAEFVDRLLEGRHAAGVRIRSQVVEQRSHTDDQLVAVVVSAGQILLGLPCLVGDGGQPVILHPVSGS